MPEATVCPAQLSRNDPPTQTAMNSQDGAQDHGLESGELLTPEVYQGAGLGLWTSYSHGVLDGDRSLKAESAHSNLQ